MHSFKSKTSGGIKSLTTEEALRFVCIPRVLYRYDYLGELQPDGSYIIDDNVVDAYAEAQYYTNSCKECSMKYASPQELEWHVYHEHQK